MLHSVLRLDKAKEELRDIIYLFSKSARIRYRLTFHDVMFDFTRVIYVNNLYNK